jgi:hypothetical protein
MIRFGLFADPQYCEREPSLGRWYRLAPERLRECVDELNTRGVAFVMNLGDLIDRNYASFDTMLAVLGRSEAPVYHALGNHDFEVRPRLKSRVPRRLGLKRAYYDFRHGRNRFIVLDGNEVSLFANREGTRIYRRAQRLYERMTETGAVNAAPWSGAMSRRQLRWLERRLHRARQRGERVIVFSHFPVFPEDRHNLWNEGELLRVLEQGSCVAAYIAGHKHDGGYGFRNGIHHLTLAAMVNTDRSSAYAVAELFDDRLELRGLGRQESRVLSLKEGVAAG